MIGADSRRRQAQMRALRPDVVMTGVRGTIPERMRRMQNENIDGIIQAFVASLEDRIGHIFDPQAMTPAPAEGIIAIQLRRHAADSHGAGER